VTLSTGAERYVEKPLGPGDHATRPARLAHRARAEARRYAPLARRRRRRGVSVVSFAIPAMAATPLSRSCPIRIISVHLLDAAGRLLRVLFLDREGHISAQQHYVPREEALILASNQQRVSVPRPMCGCSEHPLAGGAPASGFLARSLGPWLSSKRHPLQSRSPSMR
jgi:hypothetical protein